MSLLAWHKGNKVNFIPLEHAQLRTHPGTLHVCLDLRKGLLKLTTIRLHSGRPLQTKQLSYCS